MERVPRALLRWFLEQGYLVSRDVVRFCLTSKFHLSLTTQQERNLLCCNYSLLRIRQEQESCEKDVEKRQILNAALDDKTFRCKWCNLPYALEHKCLRHEKKCSAQLCRYCGLIRHRPGKCPLRTKKCPTCSRDCPAHFFELTDESMVACRLCHSVKSRYRMNINLWTCVKCAPPRCERVRCNWCDSYSNCIEAKDHTCRDFTSNQLRLMDIPWRSPDAQKCVVKLTPSVCYVVGIGKIYVWDINSLARPMRFTDIVRVVIPVPGWPVILQRNVARGPFEVMDPGFSNRVCHMCFALFKEPIDTFCSQDCLREHEEMKQK